MSTYEIIKKTHFIVVTIFFLIYLIKTVLLLLNKNQELQSFSKKVRLLEIIVSFLFLATGIYLMFNMAVIPMMLIIKITIVFLSIPLAVVGYKKHNKALATVAFILILAAFGIGEMMKNKSAVVSENAVNTDGTSNGQELYTSNCLSCHGNNGKANLAGALDLTATHLNNDSIAGIILNGRNTMPKINGLTQEQALAIAVYITTNIKGK